MSRFSYTEDMKVWMRNNYLLLPDDLIEGFKKEFGELRTFKSLHSFRKRLGLNTGRTGKFIKGHVPVNKGTKGLTGANKTSFKKNNRPLNYQPIGTESTTKDGYIKVKTAEPNIWKLKHRLVWEKYKGEIPTGYIIKFIDDNKLNCHIDNLMMISMRENAVINKHYSGAPAEYKHTTLQLAKIKLAISDRTKRQDQC